MADPKSTYEWLKEHHNDARYSSWIKDAEEGFLAEGTHTIEVFEVTPGDPKAMQWAMPDGTSAVVGVPLREIRKKLGGDEGYWTNPADGAPMKVSLAQWKDRDPDTTLLFVRIVSNPLR